LAVDFFYLDGMGQNEEGVKWPWSSTNMELNAPPIALWRLLSLPGQNAQQAKTNDNYTPLPHSPEPVSQLLTQDRQDLVWGRCLYGQSVG